MNKQRILRFLVFGIIVGGTLLALDRWTQKSTQKGEKVLPAQVEKVIEGLRDFPEGKEIPLFKEKILGTEIEQKVEEKVEEVIKEIKSLPEEQLEEVKKEVFCTQVCDKTCQEVCE